MARPEAAAVTASSEAPLMKSRRTIMLSSRCWRSGFSALDLALFWRIDREHYSRKPKAAHRSVLPCRSSASGLRRAAEPCAQPHDPPHAPLAHVLDRHQHCWRNDEGEHGREAEPEYDRGREIDPPLRRRRADDDFAGDELDIHPERNWQHTEDRGHRREHNRPRALAAGLNDGVIGGDTLAAQPVVGVRS